MPSIQPPHVISVGPGWWYRSVLGTALPGTGTGGVVTGGKFTDAWDAAWIPAGVTRDGSQISYELTTEDIEVAEYLDALETDETGRNITVGMDLAHIVDRTYLLAFGGGTSTTISGTGASTLTKVSPPALGGSVGVQLGWESQDSTERMFFYVCKQTGSVQWNNSKAPNYKSFPLSFKVSQPTSGNPFDIFLAGTTRLVAA